MSSRSWWLAIDAIGGLHEVPASLALLLDEIAWTLASLASLSFLLWMRELEPAPPAVPTATHKQQHHNKDEQSRIVHVLRSRTLSLAKREIDTCLIGCLDLPASASS